jgi:hypothetical protein
LNWQKILNLGKKDELCALHVSLETMLRWRLRLKQTKSGAMEAFYNRYAGHVQRILASIVNIDTDLAELLQEIFIQAFVSVASDS